MNAIAKSFNESLQAIETRKLAMMRSHSSRKSAQTLPSISETGQFSMASPRRQFLPSSRPVSAVTVRSIDSG